MSITSSGELLNGRYRLVRPVARGGVGDVWTALDERLDREVAVKMLRPDADPGLRRRFLDEAALAARMAHPNVVAVFDSGLAGETPYIVMESLPGRTLVDEFGEGPLSEARARRVAVQMLDALDAAHRAGIVHRDVKPANVLLDEHGDVKLTDFGIASSHDRNGPPTTGIVGTPAYLAPERVAGQVATRESDLYAVGVVLYEALTGVNPFHRDSPLAVCHAINHEVVPPISSVRPGLSAELVHVVERAMARDPQERFASAAAMRAALGGRPDVSTTQLLAPMATADTTQVSQPTGALPAASPAPPSRRRPAQAVVAALLVAVVIGIVIVGLLARDSGQSEDPAIATETGPDSAPDASEAPVTTAATSATPPEDTVIELPPGVTLPAELEAVLRDLQESVER